LRHWTKANEAGGIPSFAPLTQSRRIGKPLESEVFSRSLRATPGNCLSREITGESVKGDGGNENRHPRTVVSPTGMLWRCDSLLNKLISYSPQTQTKAPQTQLSRGTHRLISPPPKASHNHRMLRSSPWEWLQRATVGNAHHPCHDILGLHRRGH
jgi:hypothetical protein